MGTYLVVMDRAIPPQSLRFGLLNLASRHRPADFVLLRTQQLVPGASRDAAHHAATAYAASARSLLTAMGLSVIDAFAGDPVPLRAIADAMAGEHTYAGIVLTSRAPLLPSLLQVDVAHRLQRRYGIPVTCIDPDTSVAVGRGALARAGGGS